MDCYEAVFGTRMHATTIAPAASMRLAEKMPEFETSARYSAGELNKLNEARGGSMLDFLEAFTDRFPACVDEYETPLTDNRIWKQRTVGIGVVTRRGNSLASGAMLRGPVSVGPAQKQPYEVYADMDFDIPVG